MLHTLLPLHPQPFQPTAPRVISQWAVMIRQLVPAASHYCCSLFNMAAAGQHYPISNPSPPFAAASERLGQLRDVYDAVLFGYGWHDTNKLPARDPPRARHALRYYVEPAMNAREPGSVPRSKQSEMMVTYVNVFREIHGHKQRILVGSRNRDPQAVTDAITKLHTLTSIDSRMRGFLANASRQKTSPDPGSVCVNCRASLAQASQIRRGPCGHEMHMLCSVSQHR